jgi:hypothetical protein
MLLTSVELQRGCRVATAPERAMRLSIKTLQGETFPLDIEPSVSGRSILLAHLTHLRPAAAGHLARLTLFSQASGAELKAAVERAKQIPAARQRVIYKGKVLKDEDALSAYGAGPSSLRPARRALTRAQRQASRTAMPFTSWCGAKTWISRRRRHRRVPQVRHTRGRRA